jgi:hypothetical protein
LWGLRIPTERISNPASIEKIDFENTNCFAKDNFRICGYKGQPGSSLLTRIGGSDKLALVVYLAPKFSCLKQTQHGKIAEFAMAKTQTNMEATGPRRTQSGKLRMMWL